MPTFFKGEKIRVRSEQDKTLQKYCPDIFYKNGQEFILEEDSYEHHGVEFVKLPGARGEFWVTRFEKARTKFRKGDYIQVKDNENNHNNCECKNFIGKPFILSEDSGPIVTDGQEFIVLPNSHKIYSFRVEKVKWIPTFKVGDRLKVNQYANIPRYPDGSEFILTEDSFLFEGVERVRLPNRRMCSMGHEITRFTKIPFVPKFKKGDAIRENDKYFNKYHFIQAFGFADNDSYQVNGVDGPEEVVDFVFYDGSIHRQRQIRWLESVPIFTPLFLKDDILGSTEPSTSTTFMMANSDSYLNDNLEVVDIKFADGNIRTQPIKGLFKTVYKPTLKKGDVVEIGGNSLYYVLSDSEILWSKECVRLSIGYVTVEGCKKLVYSK